MNRPLLIVAISCIACISRAAEPDPVGVTSKTYLGKPIANLTVHDFKSLPDERRNRVIAEIVRAGPLRRTELDLLRDLSNEKLLTEPTVLGSLIEVLERAAPKSGQVFAQEQANDISTAVQILRQITRRDCGNAVMNQREKQPDKVRKVVDWWSQWWAKNHDKHPMIDAALEATITKRVAAIASQLIADLGGDYYELRYLQPKNVRVSYIEPLVDIQIASSKLAEVVLRRDAAGKQHRAKDEEHTYTRIRVAFKTEKPLGEGVIVGQQPPESLAPLGEEVFTEDIPGTDLIIIVDAAQQKGDFVRRARESLSKLRLSPTRK